MSLTFPARFMLAAAMNPCPCGFHNDRSRECHCTPPMIQRYISKISGPLLDRIDIHIDVPAVNYKELRSNVQAETSTAIRGRVMRARDRILKGSRTVADLEGAEHLEAKHIAEAIQYRTLDRTYWA